MKFPGSPPTWTQKHRIGKFGFLATSGSTSVTVQGSDIVTVDCGALIGGQIGSIKC